MTDAPLNYHHLRYFWAVARTGSIKAACRELGLTPPTISAQVRLLEESLGEALFDRDGRSLELTEVGRTVVRYAEQIFSLGREMSDALHGKVSVPVLHVGVSDLVPKLITHQILQPVLELAPKVRLQCREGKTSQLLGQLATHELDVVLADEPIPSTVSVRAYNHLIGTSGVTFFATSELGRAHRGKFPKRLRNAPWLLPTPNTPMRRSLDYWLAQNDLQPDIVGEFDDTALLKVFGEFGAGFFAGPTVIAKEIEAQYGVRSFGSTEDVRESFYVITAHRRLRHPAVLAISERAQELF